jgi:hypothetical protein
MLDRCEGEATPRHHGYGDVGGLHVMRLSRIKLPLKRLGARRRNRRTTSERAAEEHSNL